MFPKILFYFLLFLSIIKVTAQSYTPKIEPSSLAIESNSFPGFKTFLDFDSKDVRKGWWKFAKEFGKPVNMRKYYETTLIHEDMANVKLISKSVKFHDGTMFYLTLNNQGIPSDLEKKYLGQVRNLLFDFKQEYYRSFLEEELQSLEKQAIKVTRQLDKARGDAFMEDKAFTALEKVNKAMDELKGKITALSK
ncbi:MAG: hypothetical protein ACFHWX_21185 [Bacteroidota bacterium]